MYVPETSEMLFLAKFIDLFDFHWGKFLEGHASLVNVSCKSRSAILTKRQSPQVVAQSLLFGTRRDRYNVLVNAPPEIDLVL